MKKMNTNQKGNVLFLILIAVALFAALSYAVTQSSRSGGDSGRETNILNSAQLSQYPNQIRTAVLRQVIDGVSVLDVEFNKPASFATLTTANRGVFHPSGGGAVFQDAPADMMANGSPGVWTYNIEFEVPEIGLTTADNTLGGNDLIAFLAGVSVDVCQRINAEAGITASTATAPPVIGSDFSGTTAGSYGINMVTGYDNTTGRDETLDNAGNDFTGQPFGCFDNGTTASGIYVYYHVLNER